MDVAPCGVSLCFCIFQMMIHCYCCPVKHEGVDSYQEVPRMGVISKSNQQVENEIFIRFPKLINMAYICINTYIS